MKNSTLTFSIIIMLIGNVFSQNFEFAKSLLGTDYDAAESICIDNLGNIYITGGFQGTIYFDPSSADITLTSTNSNDIFIAKYDSLGNFLWVKHIFGTSNETSSFIKTDSIGNIYITGSFSGSLDLNPDTVAENIVSTYYDEVFFAKYDADGNFMWGHNFGNSAGEHIYDMIIDENSNLILTGDFFATIDFDPSNNVHELTSTSFIYGSTKDSYIAKYNTDGDYMWVNKIGDVGYETAKSIVINNNSIYVAVNENFDYVQYIYTFLYKFDLSGNKLDSMALIHGSCLPYDIFMDNNANLYITGTFSDTLDFYADSTVYNLIKTGNTNLFIAKFDNNFNFIWAKQIAGVSDLNVVNIDLLNNQTLYITGNFRDSITFDQSINITSKGYEDYFTLNLDVFGNFISFYSIGGNSSGINTNCFYVSNNVYYITGGFNGTIDFDPGAASSTLTSIGNSDMFFAKYRDISTSIKQNEQNNSITLFPNPCSDFLNCSLSVNNEDKFNIEIYNAIGEAEFKTQQVFSNNETIIPVNISGLSKGIHFLKLSNQNGQYIKGFIKD